ncbi:MAG: GNAT family N-acetyltransferase [Deltaproteobacteria bacterium]|nr:GNAT family N-acetyltransferase [Deltaproteobacteria bacterium]MDQ3295444.1 GNAT family N-acetyltransferase [Myxococcota bacterium]
MIALALPDEPRWVEAHGIAGDPASWQRVLGAGGAVGSERARLAVVYGEADPEATVALARAYPDHAMLVTDELVAALRHADRLPCRAILHTLAEPDGLPDLEGAMLLPADADLAHVPAPLAAELAQASRVWTAYVDGAPVAFAYAPWRSARWFDVSVDTLPGARQLGLGTLVAAAMIHDERGAGREREPVWGADEGNLASLRLARRLGFVAVDEVWLAPPRT